MVQDCGNRAVTEPELQLVNGSKVKTNNTEYRLTESTESPDLSVHALEYVLPSRFLVLFEQFIFYKE